mgnify:FL=1
MRLGTKSKTTPTGLPAAGWWRRVVATLVDDTLTFFVVWLSALVCATVIGKVIFTAATKTIQDVRVKLGDVIDGVASAGNIQQQIQDLVDAWRASGKTVNDLANLIAQDYVRNLNLTFTQAFLLMACIVGSFYFVVYNHVIRVSRKGRTFGDEIVGIYTVAESGKFPSYKAAFIRYFVIGFLVVLVSLIGSLASSLANIANTVAAFVIYVNVLYPLFDKHARAVHDVIAKTYPTHPDRFGYALAHLGKQESAE